MAAVNITDVRVLGNVAPFKDPITLEISLDYCSQLSKELVLDFEVIYVSSANSQKDQKLACVDVGPIPFGASKFPLTVDPPRENEIDESDLVGVSALLVRALYQKCEFIRVGYIVNVYYSNVELQLNPPSPPLVQHLFRDIHVDKPRVTMFHLNWENPELIEYPSEVLVDGQNPDDDCDDDDDDDDDDDKEFNVQNAFNRSGRKRSDDDDEDDDDIDDDSGNEGQMVDYTAEGAGKLNANIAFNNANTNTGFTQPWPQQSFFASNSNQATGPLGTGFFSGTFGAPTSQPQQQQYHLQQQQQQQQQQQLQLQLQPQHGSMGFFNGAQILQKPNNGNFGFGGN